MPGMWRGVAVFCFTALCAGGESTIMAESGPWTATLDGAWRWHAGDNMRWASAAFNDADWSALRVPGPLPPGERYWVRLHFQMGRTSDPGLTLGPIAWAYDVYWDGERIGNFGDLSRLSWFVPRWQTYPVPPNLAMPGSHIVAIRIAQIGPGVGLPARQSQVYAGDNRVGDVAALYEAAAAQMGGDFQPWLLNLLIDFGFLLAGFYFLLLAPSLSKGSAFRWFGMVLVGRAFVVMCQFYLNYGPLNIPGNIIAGLFWAGVWVSCLGTIEFSYAFFRRPVPPAVRCVAWVLAALASPVPLPYSAITARLAVLLIPGIAAIAVAAGEFRKHTLDAGLTLVLFAVLGGTALYNLIAVEMEVRQGIPAPVVINIAGFRLWSWDAMYLVWVPAMAMQIHKTNLRFRDERERLRGEMEAARQVQQLLLPSQSSQFQGFDIDASYHPASEVGGDFFQLFGVVNGSLLVVVGDVSGKGMKAALLVSLIAGALRNRKSDEPAHVLKELNALLLGSSEGGFTTCCCALFGADGGVMIANAGQLVPYRNGEEIPISPALPLGIEANADWPELRIELAPGDRLLWVSDGVVEARNGKGNLLGFGRAQELATRSAGEIAEAAQQFGQEDDITVISITREPVPVHVG